MNSATVNPRRVAAADWATLDGDLTTGLLGGAFGWILRSTAGAIGALVGILLVLPTLVLLLPGSLAADLTPYLPSNAGEAFIDSVRTDGALEPWTGLAVFALWVGAALVAAAVAVRRRDA